MEITKAALEARKAELAEQFKQAVSNANALNGALQDCEHWIKILEQPVAALGEQCGNLKSETKNPVRG